MSEKDLSEEAKTLLHDYKLIQYDRSAGKNYRKDTNFVELQQIRIPHHRQFLQ